MAVTMAAKRVLWYLLLLKMSISASSSRFSNAIVIRYDTSSTLMAHDVIRWQNANWKIARSKDKRVSFYSNLGFSSSSL